MVKGHDRKKKYRSQNTDIQQYDNHGQGGFPCAADGPAQHFQNDVQEIKRERSLYDSYSIVDYRGIRIEDPECLSAEKQCGHAGCDCKRYPHQKADFCAYFHSLYFPRADVLRGKSGDSLSKSNYRQIDNKFHLKIRGKSGNRVHAETVYLVLRKNI